MWGRFEAGLGVGWTWAGAGLGVGWSLVGAGLDVAGTAGTLAGTDAQKTH